MRHPAFLAIVIIVILGLLVNESAGQQKPPPPPPAPTVKWSAFNIHPDGSLSRRIERLLNLLYPSIRAPMILYEPHMWLKSLAPALIEAYSMGYVKLHDVIHTFSQIVTEDDVQIIIAGVGRMSPRFEVIGIVSASVNRPLGIINKLSGDARAKEIEHLVYECVYRIGYKLPNREGNADLEISTQEAWVIIMSWLLQYYSGDD